MHILMLMHNHPYAPLILITGVSSKVRSGTTVSRILHIYLRYLYVSLACPTLVNSFYRFPVVSTRALLFATEKQMQHKQCQKKLDLTPVVQNQDHFPLREPDAVQFALYEFEFTWLY